MFHMKYKKREITCWWKHKKVMKLISSNQSALHGEKYMGEADIIISVMYSVRRKLYLQDSGGFQWPKSIQKVTCTALHTF